MNFNVTPFEGKLQNIESIVIFSPTFIDGQGGIERFVAGHIEELSKTKKYIIFAVFFDGILKIDDGFIKTVKRYDRKHFYLHFFKYSRKGEWVIVHDPHLYKILLPVWFFSLNGMRRHLSLFTHGLFFHTNDYWPIKKLVFFFMKYLCFLANSIFTAGYADYKALSTLSHINLCLLGNGIDDFNYVDSVKTSKRSFRFVCIGRDSPNKKLADAIRVYNDIITQTFNQCELLIISPNLTQGTQELIKHSRKIKVVEGADDAKVSELLASCDVLLSASVFEGFGRTIVEAGLRGVIPFVNQNEGHSFISSKVENMFVVNWSNSVSLSVSILELAEILNSKTYGSYVNKLRQQCEYFLWSNIARQIDEKIGFEAG